mmetsp:Transcript_8291/g.17245  ORF Transcript_8291/g.17245 Transcript_8291/m.17245 type:complete len:290 (-) Transcript_8291:502-1371(-)
MRISACLHCIPYTCIVCLFFREGFRLVCACAFCSQNFQFPRDDGPRVDKVFSVDVLDDAKVLVDIVDVHPAGCLPSLVPRQEFPDGTDRYLDLPDDVSQQRQSVQSLHLSGGRVIDHHVEAGHRPVVEDIGLGFPAGCGRDDAPAKGRQELEPPEDRDHRQTEERGIEGAVEVFRGGVDVLGDPSDLRGPPRAGLELVELEEEARFAGPVLEGLGLCEFVGFLDGQKEGRAPEDPVRDRREDQFPFPAHFFQGFRDRGRNHRGVFVVAVVVVVTTVAAFGLCGGGCCLV